jgi:hypothetical protein
MQAAFIVKLDVDSGIDKSVTAEEIREELEASNFVVLDVQPWSSPGEAKEQAGILGMQGVNVPFAAPPADDGFAI